jgi:hypothetical protein
VFVLASARSCTSVVTAMLGQHPQLYGLPELKLFAYPTLGELDASLPREARDRGLAHRSPGLVRAVAQLELGGQGEHELAAALAWLRERQGWSGKRALDHLAAHVAPRAIVEKSPEHVADDDALARLARAYPSAHFLHLLRHPVAAIRSLEEHLRRRLPAYRPESHRTHLVEQWLDCQERILRLTASQPFERSLRVRAEDVLGDPPRALRAIAEWLGVRADAAAVDAMLHPERSPFARPAPAASGVSGGHDPGFLADPIPHPVELPARIEAPAEWRIDGVLWERVRRAALALGYG